MGGEWNIMGIMDEAEVVCISGAEEWTESTSQNNIDNTILSLYTRGDIVLAISALH